LGHGGFLGLTNVGASPLEHAQPDVEVKVVGRGKLMVQSNWFIVFEAKGHWWIDNEGTEFGPFSSREAAGAEAIVIARRFADRSRRSLIYWPDETGRQTMIWEDRGPPKLGGHGSNVDGDVAE
jgi:hypothetical protein